MKDDEWERSNKKMEHFFDEDYVDFKDFVYDLDLSDRTKERIMRCLYFERNNRIVELFSSKDEEWEN